MRNIVVMLISLVIFGCTGKAQENTRFPVQKSEAQWKEILSPGEFAVLRKKGTEPAFSSRLNDIDSPGTFVCAGCQNPLYRTKHKFDSGTGWPSFDRPVSQKNVTYRPDPEVGYQAREVLCARCGGHLGHVFNDGPRETTGKRHCINGLALEFIPEMAED